MNITIFKKANKIKKLRTKLIKKLKYNNGYSILRSSKTLIENEYLMGLAKEYDEYGYMSQGLGEELDRLFEDDSYIIGIHRTGYTHMDSEMISSIFNEGLVNNGHLMSSGVINSQPNIERTVTLFKNFTILNGQLKAANGYKGSEGCIIVKIPKSYLGKSDGEIKPIYYQSNTNLNLLPEFIYGYVPVNKDGVLDDLRHNPNYKDIHTYDNENLIYDSQAIAFDKRNSIDLDEEKPAKK